MRWVAKFLILPNEIGKICWATFLSETCIKNLYQNIIKIGVRFPASPPKNL